ncbi:MAG: tRNA lysidine(34) synthetase TilS [bacterium]
MLAPGDRVVLGVSGGPDSIAMLYIFKETLAPRYDLSLCVAHLNHGIRPSADYEEDFVRSTSRDLGLEFFSRRVDVPGEARSRRRSIEEAGRDARYAFFNDIFSQFGGTKIALAHTADDNIETLLIRLLRGAGSKGLCGIPPVRGHIIRPLIEVFRSEVEAFLKVRNLSYCLDESNSDTTYLRNWVRLELIPLLSRCNLRIRETLVRTGEILRGEDDFLESVAESALGGVRRPAGREELALDIASLRGLHRAIQRRVIRKAISLVKGDLRRMEYGHVENIIALMGERTGASVNLPDGLLAERSYKHIILRASDSGGVPHFAYPLSVPSRVSVAELGVDVTAEIVSEREREGEDVAYFDYDRLAQPLILRNRRPGDRFRLDGGRKKLKDYFIDEKVERRGRDRILLLASGDEIVWVVGFRKVENIMPDTKRFLRVFVRGARCE